LFVIALRKRLALVDGDAGCDHPLLIGVNLREFTEEVKAILGAKRVLIQKVIYDDLNISVSPED